MRKKNPVEKLYTVTPASLLKEAKYFREYAEESLKYWILAKQTEKYPEAMAKARILETAAREKNVAVRREILKNSGFDIVRFKSSMPRKSRAGNPIDEHELAYEDAGSGWINSTATEHNPAGRSWSGPARIAWTKPNGDREIKTVRPTARARWLIGGRDVDFFAHKDGRKLVVSERLTGRQLGQIDSDIRAASLGDDKAALNSFVMRMTDTYGPDKILSAIDRAPKI
jgi:hypothetical protein